MDLYSIHMNGTGLGLQSRIIPLIQSTWFELELTNWVLSITQNE